MNVIGGNFALQAETIEGPSDAGQDWFTAAELAELALPGLPADKRSLNRRAKDERWALRCAGEGEALSRNRSGRGGGIEFHVSLLPGQARLELVKRGICNEAPQPGLAESAAASAWRWFETQSAKVKDEAQRRAAAIAEFDLLIEAGLTRTAAVADVALRHRASTATLWNWLKLVEGVAPSDRLPALAPQRKGGGNEAEIDGELWTLLRSDWLRPEAPTLTSCFARVGKIAAARGLPMPSERSIRRKIEREIDPLIVVRLRGGADQLDRRVPDQRRTLDGLHALDLINIDGHQFDVFVTPPGGGSPVRPMMVAIQDVYSRKMLAWRLDFSENVLATRLAFSDLFREYGIPKQCLLDNSRTFASKALTGGAKTRYRFKIKDEEPSGLLTSLGIRVRFAQVYHGQSKPIERAFRDLSDTISRGPECAGAYTGNKPTAKPSNYGSRAVPWAEFEAIVARGIAAHNAKLGRKGGVCRGRSFDEVFAESYARAPIGKATPEQLRIALLAAEQKRVNGRTGEIELFGNRYWSAECSRIAGTRVTVRFDPDDLRSDVHLYGLDGRYLTSAQCVDDSGFLEQAGAVAAGKRKKDVRRKIREGIEAEQLLAIEQVAAAQVGTETAVLRAPQVVRPVRHRATAAALKPQVQPAQPEHQTRVFNALGMLRSVE
ncbi:MAG: transposase domain-containing protein [Novosphingobium sp.]|uniref:transposase domain-containing protein n=1 Tax=Novosphingobium sp. TaxID=1874826 RepID=UPI0032BB0FED